MLLSKSRVAYFVTVQGVSEQSFIYCSTFSTPKKEKILSPAVQNKILQ